MDQLRAFLDAIAAHGLAIGHFRGFLHLLVGRRITLADGTHVSAGMTWREAAALLKRCRWDREAVAELGLNPADLPPRDREKYWYVAISRAGLTTAEARAEADSLLPPLLALGYVVGPAPGEASGKA